MHKERPPAEPVPRRAAMPKGSAVLVAVYRNLSDAEAAAGELTAHAFAGDHIHVLSRDSRAIDAGGSPRLPGRVEQNVNAWCAAAFGLAHGTKQERYDTVLRKGKTLVSLNTPEQMVDTATEILQRHSPIDVTVGAEWNDVWNG
jgi:hypothetical protein